MNLPATKALEAFIVPAMAAVMLASAFSSIGWSTAASAETRSDARPAGAQNNLELRAVGMRFEGPSEIPSGWVTIHFENLSGMIHFALIDRLPTGVTVEQMQSEVAAPFQHGMDQLNAGDVEAAGEAFAALPEWMGDVVYLGGPGLLSAGKSASATVYLEPGHYMFECYIKTNGIFHTYNPQPGQLGMVHELIVTDAPGGAAEPDANVTLAISSAGFEVVDGEFRPGRNIVRAQFRDQQVYANFVGHDAHVFRIDEDTDVDAVARWMDWRDPVGFETPAPAIFVGGVNDMPAGATTYFSVDLEPGDYAFIAEVPDPHEHGLLLPFTVE
jgi:hypothetical protein